MSDKVSTETAEDGRGDDLEPRVNRRRPFELHWRKAPPAWAGRVELNYRRLYPHLTGDDLCCVQCGSRPCPVDHDEEAERKLRDVEFIGTIVAQKNSLANQLNEMRIALEETAKQKEAWAVEKESLQRQLAEKERTCRMLDRERSSLMRSVSRLNSRRGRSAEPDSRQRPNTGTDSSVELQTADTCRERSEEDKVEDEQQELRSSKHENIEVIDVQADTSSSSTSADEDRDKVDDPNSPQTLRKQQRKHRTAAHFGQLKRRLAESSDRASQLELQLAKTKDLLDAANKRIAEHSCFADDDEATARFPFPRGGAGWRPYARLRVGLQAKREVDQQLRSAAYQLEETEKAKRELDERLSSALTELRAAHGLRAQLAAELAARDGELADLRRQMAADRGFRRHVEVLRELTEARELNDSLHEQLQAKSGDRALGMLSVDGKLRRSATATTATTGRSKRVGAPASHLRKFSGPA